VNQNKSQDEVFEIAGEFVFDLTQQDLEAIAKLYDQIRDQLRNYQIGNDMKYASEFDSLSLSVAQDLKQVIHKPSHSVNKKCCIVKNKFLMYSLCLDKYLELLKNSELQTNISESIYSNMNSEFMKLLSLLSNSEESKDKDDITELKIENESLRTELEMVKRELNSLQNNTKRSIILNTTTSFNPLKGYNNKGNTTPISTRILPSQDESGGSNSNTINPRYLTLKQLKDII